MHMHGRRAAFEEGSMSTPMRCIPGLALYRPGRSSGYIQMPSAHVISGMAHTMNKTVSEQVAAAGGSGTVGEVALLALKLGFTAFGGPAAHIAMLRDEAVTRRKWLTDT